MKYVKKVLGYLRRADNDFNLINDNDKIAVGVSGGKDSLTLLYCLNLYKKYSGKNFEILGLFVDVGFKQVGFENVCDFFKKQNVEIIKVDTQIKDILEMHLVHGEYNCYTCSKLKKGALINKAKELACNKVAYGHHLDDALETLMLNEIYSGKIETIKFKHYFDREDITMIRPLMYSREEEIKKAAGEINLPIMKSNCPKDGVSKRQEMKDLLEYIYNKFPDAKNNFENMIQKPELVVLWNKENKSED